MGVCVGADVVVGDAVGLYVGLFVGSAICVQFMG